MQCAISYYSVTLLYLYAVDTTTITLYPSTKYIILPVTILMTVPVPAFSFIRAILRIYLMSVIFLKRHPSKFPVHRKKTLTLRHTLLHNTLCWKRSRDLCNILGFPQYENIRAILGRYKTHDDDDHTVCPQNSETKCASAFVYDILTRCCIGASS
jgi:hypothetical protein